MHPQQLAQCWCPTSCAGCLQPVSNALLHKSLSLHQGIISMSACWLPSTSKDTAWPMLHLSQEGSGPLQLLPCRWVDLTALSPCGSAVPLQLCCNTVHCQTVHCHTTSALQLGACSSEVPPHTGVCWPAAPLNTCLASHSWAPTHCSCPADGRLRLWLPSVAHLVDCLGQLQRSVYHHDGHQPYRALPRPETAA